MSNEAAASPRLRRQGVLLVIASPSGAGKSTLSRLLLQDDPTISLSISATTRPRRSSEVDGVHYHFVSRARFESMRAGGELLESAEVHGNLYGTPRAPVEQALGDGRDFLFDIDYQGTLQLYETMREHVVSVFILPPSASALKARLERRAEDSPDVIRRRLETARTELRHWSEFDHLIVNDDLDTAFATLKSVLAAARASRVRNAETGEFAERMSRELDAMLASAA
ncbi:MAG: guanylate kinase [Beijerinckiaceae bacterium]